MIVIACRASAAIGLGHLTRSRALADVAAAMGVRATLVGPPRQLQANGDEKRFDGWISYPPDGADFPSARGRLLIETASQRGSRHVVLDDYSFSGEDQLRLRRSGLRLMQQYDASAPPHFAADLAVNASPAEHASLHAARLLHDGVTFLNGPRYAILRPAFADVARREPGRDVRRILVTFGGGGDRGGISMTIAALAPMLPAGVRLVVMTGSGNPGLPAIAGQIARTGGGNVDLELDHPDPPGLIASCDMAVMAGGTSIYEAAYCGLPMMLFSIAPNQAAQCQGWQDLGAAQYLGAAGTCDAADLAKAALGLIEDKDRRLNMSKAGIAQVDLDGGRRLLAALMEHNL